MKTKVIINIIIVIGLLSLVVGKLYSNKQQKDEKLSLVEKSRRPIPVIVSTVTFDKVPISFYERGTFEPASQITILSESQGRVVSVNVIPGKSVREGDVLATLENKVLDYQLAIAEAAYKKAQKDYDRYSKLTPDEAISTSQMEDAGLALENARNSFMIMKKQFEDLKIKTSIKGKISRKFIEIGSYIMPGTPTFDIVSTDRMKFITALSENELIIVQNGNAQIKIRPESNRSEFTGIISSIDQVPSTSGRYKVEIDITDGSTDDILNGKSGKATYSIFSDEKELVIDRKSIVGSLADASVYVVVDNKALLTKINVANTIGDKALISSGLSAGDQVIISGQFNINNGEAVSIKNQ